MRAWLIPLALAGVLVLVVSAWLAFRRPPARARRAPRRAGLTAAPAGSGDADRVAWVLGKLTGTPPRQIPRDGVLREALGKVAAEDFLAAAGREFGTELTLEEDRLGMTVAQFAAYAAHVRRGRRKPRAGGRKRSPRTTGDALDRLDAPLLALASELGLRRDWDLDQARRHVTKEYLRWNARIHLAAREEERASVQARLEAIGRLREALAPARR
jgi:hypothetical protein